MAGLYGFRQNKLFFCNFKACFQTTSARFGFIISFFQLIFPVYHDRFRNQTP
ncbi:hypothetical protein NEIMUCOT_04911 [Neisseria mucosa ATCC 25996]|uniref:Uncharacterized protein n=1 Tax=Neisseria mucosa (strain ATCC 25996 / DSM 4631 / NCTC 10774 / M26) TaxID=546266 RepID=D2ZWB8_NEIM2|nr:hypothetical protein NEIMUCOT_04911 [Neisseria mucosa ATCC 25996]